MYFENKKKPCLTCAFQIIIRVVVHFIVIATNRMDNCIFIHNEGALFCIVGW